MSLSRFTSGIKSFVELNRYMVKVSMPRVFTGATTSDSSARVAAAGKLLSSGMYCSIGAIPGRSFTTVDHITYGPKRTMPLHPLYNSLELSFILASDDETGYNSADILRYFTAWHNHIVNPRDALVGYHADYVATINIELYSRYARPTLPPPTPEGRLPQANPIDPLSIQNGPEANDPIWSAEVLNAYPTAITDLALRWDDENHQLPSLSVTFQYTTWRETSVPHVTTGYHPEGPPQGTIS